MNERLLAQWAETHALSDERAEAIRRTVLKDGTPGLDSQWWQALFAPLRPGRQPLALRAVAR